MRHAVCAIIGEEDGLIRVEFEFERQTVVNNWSHPRKPLND